MRFGNSSENKFFLRIALTFYYICDITFTRMITENLYHSIMSPGDGPAAPLVPEKVLSRMVGDLPEGPWADITIFDWSPDDDKLPVEYGFAETTFGRMLVAGTPKGVCYIGPEKGKVEVLQDFNKRFGHARRIERKSLWQKPALEFLNGNTAVPVVFHLKGTPYQTEIWRKLLRIPFGKVVSYATLGGGARHARAAGTATGRNPIFWIVPCHRVVNTSGRFDRYFWGSDMKNELLAWEFAVSPDKAEIAQGNLFG